MTGPTLAPLITTTEDDLAEVARDDMSLLVFLLRKELDAQRQRVATLTQEQGANAGRGRPAGG